MCREWVFAGFCWIIYPVKLFKYFVNGWVSERYNYCDDGSMFLNKQICQAEQKRDKDKKKHLLHCFSEGLQNVPVEQCCSLFLQVSPGGSSTEKKQTNKQHHIQSGILTVLFGECEKHLRQNPLSHTKWYTDSAIWWVRKTLTTKSVVTYEAPEWMDKGTPGCLPRTATLVTQRNHCVK